MTDAVVQALLEQRSGGEAKWLLWIVARNRETDTDDGIGIWQGDDDQTFVIDTENRTYQGVGQNIDFGTINHGVGLLVRSHTVALNGALQRARVLIRNYDFAGATAEVHVAHLDPRSGNLIHTARHFKGYIDEAPMTIGADRGPISLSLDMVSSVRDLTSTPALMKSHASQEVLSNDQFRKYGTVSNVLADKWL